MKTHAFKLEVAIQKNPLSLSKRMVLKPNRFHIRLLNSADKFSETAVYKVGVSTLHKSGLLTLIICSNVAFSLGFSGRQVATFPLAS
jgi:hypothetical protein